MNLLSFFNHGLDACESDRALCKIHAKNNLFFNQIFLKYSENDPILYIYDKEITFKEVSI